MGERWEEIRDEIVAEWSVALKTCCKNSWGFRDACKRIAALEAERDELVQTVDRLRTEPSEEAKYLRQSRDELREQRDRFSAAFRDTTDMLCRAEAERDKWKGANKRNAAKVQELEEAESRLRAERDEARKDYERVVDKRHEEMQAHIAQIDELRAQLEKARETADMFSKIRKVAVRESRRSALLEAAEKFQKVHDEDPTEWAPNGMVADVLRRMADKTGGPQHP